MAITNPVIADTQPTRTPMEPTYAPDGGAVGKAVASIADTASGLVNANRLSKYEEAIDSVDALFNTDVLNSKKQTEDQLAGLEADKSLEGKQLEKAMRRAEIIGQQKNYDTSVVAAMKETVFRQWSARYNDLAPEFLKIAKEAGLGSSGVSKSTELNVKSYDDLYAAGKKADDQTSLDALTKWANGRGIFEVVEGANFIPKVVRATQLEQSKTFAEQMISIKKDTDALNSYGVAGELSSYFSTNSEAVTNELLGPLFGTARELAGGDINQQILINWGSLDNAKAGVRSQYQQRREKLRARLIKAQWDRGIKNPDVATIDKELAAYDKQAEDVTNLLGSDQAIKWMQSRDWANKAGAAVSVLPYRDQAVLTFLEQAAKVSPVGDEKLLEANDKILATMSANITGRDTPLSSPIVDANDSYTGNGGNTLRDLTGTGGKDRPKYDSVVINKIIPAAKNGIISKDPVQQRMAIDTTMDQLEAYATLYNPEKNPKREGLPDQSIVNGLFDVLMSSNALDAVQSANLAPDTVSRLWAATTFIAQAEMVEVTNQAQEAMKTKGGTVLGSRSPTDVEKADRLKNLTGIYAGMVPKEALDAPIALLAQETLHLAIDNDYSISFKADDPRGDTLASQMTVDYGDKLSRWAKGISVFSNGSPDDILRYLTRSQEAVDAGFPSSLAPRNPKSKPPKPKIGTGQPAPMVEPDTSNDNFGLRPDGSPKGRGYLGVIKLPNGYVASEYSIGVILNGKETDIPTLVPTLTKEEINLMATDIIPNHKKVPPAIQKKAIAFARRRITMGLDVFAGPSEWPK